MTVIKNNNSGSDLTGNLILTANMVLANMDFADYADYAIKAIIGGVVWMGFKMAGEYFSERFKKDK